MDKDDLLTFTDAVEYLAVSDKVLMRLLAEEDIPARKLGNQWRFSKSALLNWISHGSSKDYAKRNLSVGEEGE